MSRFSNGIVVACARWSPSRTSSVGSTAPSYPTRSRYASRSSAIVPSSRSSDRVAGPPAFGQAGATGPGGTIEEGRLQAQGLRPGHPHLGVVPVDPFDVDVELDLVPVGIG